MLINLDEFKTDYDERMEEELPQITSGTQYIHIYTLNIYVNI